MLEVLYRRRYAAIVTAALVITIVTTVAYLKPRTYEASTTVQVGKNYLNALMRDIAVSPSMEERIQSLSVMLTSRSTLLRVFEDLGMPVDRMDEAYLAKLIRYYQRATQIAFENGSGRRDSDFLTVSYRDADARFARDYVNSLVRQYAVENLAMKRKAALGANRFIYEQLDLYKDKIEQTESTLTRLKQDQGVQATARLSALRKKYDELSSLYTERHPELMRVKAEIRDLEEQRNGGKRGRKFGPGASALASAGTGTTIADLERNRDAYKKIYESLVASVGRAEVSTQVETAGSDDLFTIVEPAVLPVLPVGPPRWKIIFLGLFAGVAGGTALAVLLDMADRTIKQVTVLKGLGLPVVAVIPSIRNAAALARIRKKDRLLYGTAGTYAAGIAVLALVEYLS